MTKQQTAEKQPSVLNGVDVAGVFETIDAINADTELAKFRFRAANTWIDGGHNRSMIQGFYGCRREDDSRQEPFVLDADEPPVLLGGDAGANPVEFILHGLTACMTTSMVYHAAARGIEIEAVESALEGDIDLRGFLGISNEVRKGYQSIRVHMRVKSSAEAGTLRDLVNFSPVYDVVSRSVPVEVTIETY
jgi:uncharacterized OsmC-like protein